MLTKAELEFEGKLTVDTVSGQNPYGSGLCPGPGPEPEPEPELPAGHFMKNADILTQPTILLARAARSMRFREWLQDQKSRGIHYHLHSFSDGQLMICPSGTEVESEDGTRYTVEKDGNLVCQRTARPTSKRARRQYSRDDRKAACRRLHPEYRKRSNWHRL